MPHWNYHDIVNQANANRKELLRQAEKSRQLQIVFASRDRHRFYGALLDGLGIRLMAWGQRLHEQYGERRSERTTGSLKPAIDGSSAALCEDC